MSLLAEIESLVTSQYAFDWNVVSRRDSQGRRRAELLEGPERSVFAKYTNAPLARDKAVAEARALQKMGSIAGVRTPSVLGVVGTQESAALVLEAVQIRSPEPSDWEAVAEMVAALHRSTDVTFGLAENNFIGDFEQINRQSKDWNQFYAKQRLTPLLSLLEGSAIATSGEMELLWGVLPAIDKISTISFTPSLLHGDLWPGNVLFDQSGPILIDPAISFGCREMDIAFSKMAPHLCFPSNFYARYSEILPLSDGFEYRTELWQMWPLIAHVIQDGRTWMPQLTAAAMKYC